MDNFKAPHVCNCEELGCGSQRFELRGVLYTGKTRTRQNGEKHEAKLRRIRLKTSSSSNGQLQERNNLPARRRSLSTGDITANQAYIDESMGPIVGAAQLGRRRSSSVETVRVSANHQNTQPPASITVSTAGFQRQQVYLQRPACLIAMLRVAHASIIQNAVHDDCRKSLHMAKLELAHKKRDRSRGSNCETNPSKRPRTSKNSASSSQAFDGPQRRRSLRLQTQNKGKAADNVEGRNTSLKKRAKKYIQPSSNDIPPKPSNPPKAQRIRKTKPPKQPSLSLTDSDLIHIHHLTNV
ncbi:uncharacterized protein MELLADRAFT_114461 [Melampsora larici-populina 98AG31]|uniref:Uncharacterized protein n=1 Tax=Melampsora larici-populina (strain 98AG31 / pathotype 3-4-7) TaxID=747676 RepID=F4SDJ8_MELLP|nr:uncharacterized protein MELLADRAFT_114461 [Melampsora larici-populina 98AG31]EGF97278.1 hypothetical protein MELLADRAFT_114461 [Melampsora larici-populina 98AG31]